MNTDTYMTMHMKLPMAMNMHMVIKAWNMEIEKHT